MQYVDIDLPKFRRRCPPPEYVLLHTSTLSETHTHTHTAYNTLVDNTHLLLFTVFAATIFSESLEFTFSLLAKKLRLFFFYFLLFPHALSVCPICAILTGSEIRLTEVFVRLTVYYLVLRNIFFRIQKLTNASIKS